MNPQPHLLRRAARAVLASSIAASVLLIALAAALGSFGYVRTQILLGLLGLAAGAIIADIALGGWTAAPVRARVAIGSLLTSQAFYHLLVWTDWKMGPALWRLWWISMVASVTSAHLLGLRSTPAFPADRLGRATAACALLSGILAGALALGPRIPPEPGPWFLLAWGAFAGASAAGSVAVWRLRAARAVEPRPMPRWARFSWGAGAAAALFMAGYYLGGAGRGPQSMADLFPSALAGLPADQLEAQVRADLDRLRTVAAGLDDLSRKSETLQAELRAALRAENRDYYRPLEDDRIRAHFLSYLSFRSALLRLVATYAGFEAVRDPSLRARCFTTGYAAAVMAFEHGLALVSAYGGERLARKKLNEGEPSWGIPDGMFDRIYESVTGGQNLELCQEMGAYYRLKRDEWRAGGVWPAADFDWLDGRIERSLAFVQSRALSRTKAWFDLLVQRVKKDTYTPVYAAQSMLSTWIGDTKITGTPPLIRAEQIREIERRLRPGDILLERRNGFLSNAFLPGFWPHGALYVGRIEDLRRLGIADDPEVRGRLAEYLKPAADREPRTVLESVSEGVIFNSLTESMHADHVAVLRPRLSEKEVARAIARAFSHQGKPYDFEFDFFTSDKIVCTELVYRAYEGMLHFDLVRVMGRDTLPAVEIARKFARERGTPACQLDFVLFLDGDPEAGTAREAGEEDLCASCDRPRVFSK